MADYRAIEGASRSLRALLRDRMQEPVPVTLLPPDVEPADIDEPRVNLYLFEIKQHAQLKNQMPPGEGSPGTFGKPPLSLDLFYLLTTVFPTETATEPFAGAGERFGALSIAGRGSLRYSSTYFDTPDLRTFRSHHHGAALARTRFSEGHLQQVRRRDRGVGGVR